MLYLRAIDDRGRMHIQVQPENYLCPDILKWEILGRADTARGTVVLAFFWLLRWWPR